MANREEPIRPSTPSSSSPDTPQRPLPALPASSLPFATRRPTKSSNRGTPAASTSMKTSLEPVLEGDGRLLRDVHSPVPGDVRRLGRKASGPELSKQRSQYFEEAFRLKHYGGTRDDGSSVPSIILAEIADEFNFITDLARHLSTRYNHPATHIAISLQHGACLHFAGTFDPAYTVAVHAPPALLQPATNRRNVALLQSHFEEALRVRAARGFVRFVPVPEECSGWKGNTVAGAREKEKDGTRDKDRDEDGEKKAEQSPTHRKRAMRSLSIKRSQASDDKIHAQTRATEGGPGPLAAGQTEGGQNVCEGAEQAAGRGLCKKKSFIHSLFVKAQRGDA